MRMPESHITKQALSAALKSLMEEVPLSKISVGDIARRCGINRQTFYYHFKDKYELVNWIYYTETLPYMGNFTDLAHWTDGLCALCYYMKENKRFYINALNSSGQNSFPEYLTQFVHNLIRSILEALLEERQMPELELEFIADFYSFAFVGLIQKWAHRGMQDDPKRYIQRIQELVDGSMLKELSRFRGLESEQSNDNS